MSERVLVGPLLDFGKSLWNSPILREEFPGAENSRLQPIGKFGIGFFSVFLIGDIVRVISRRYTDAVSDLRALEINSIMQRPIVRAAKSDEVPRDFVTRVSVIMKSPTSVDSAPGDGPRLYQVGHSSDTTRLESAQRILRSNLRYLTTAVDVAIKVRDETDNFECLHNPNWLHSDVNDFLGDVLAMETPTSQQYYRTRFAPLVEHLTDEHGNNFGRAALLVGDDRRSERRLGGVSVGGFMTPSSTPFMFIGVLKGENRDVSRKTAGLDVPDSVLEQWATSQAKRYTKERFSTAWLLRAAQQVVKLGGEPGSLPFCYAGGKLVTKIQFDSILDTQNEILVSVSTSAGNENFCLDSIPRLTSRYYNEALPGNLVAVTLTHAYKNLLTDGHRDQIRADEDIDVDDTSNLDEADDLLMPMIRARWGNSLRVMVCKRQVFPPDTYSDEWFLRIAKVR